jgi:predicted dehydrogenase/nucleoside-diphosphate-sugar epimerase
MNMNERFAVSPDPGKDRSRTMPMSWGHVPRRVALLGTGYIAEWHAKALASLKDVELVAVCDRVLDRARSFAEKFDVPRVYDTLAEMLAVEHLDVVHVLLPAEHHFSAASAILMANVNVFLEKPMCSRAEDCEALIDMALKQKLRIAVSHNFLFAECYEQLRQDLGNGVFGRIDHVTVTWHRELPQLAQGPFDIWMLRDSRNVMLEVGSHCVAFVLDLIGPIDEIQVRVSNEINLSTGRNFYRRWQANGFVGETAVDLRLSFIPGFAEFEVHVRGSLASATVDLELNTYTLSRHRALSESFDRYALVCGKARKLRRQARRTMRDYLLSKMHLNPHGNPYGVSIARAMNSFYTAPTGGLDQRICGQTGLSVILMCEQIGKAAKIPSSETSVLVAVEPEIKQPPSILVLGATGFIGRELISQLIRSGLRVRAMVRTPSKLPVELQRVATLELQLGDLTCDDDLRRAMIGIDCVFHLARSNVKSWAEYQRFEIKVTERIGKAALAAGVKRLIYTGTIDSYYAGKRAGTITESTPLDPQIAHRNLYARAKAASEVVLLRMHREQKLPVVIVRPGIVVGSFGSPFHWGIGMWWHDSVCQIWGEGRNKLPLVLVSDVAKGLIDAANVHGIDGESFNLVGDPMLTAHDYLDELDRSGGIRIQRHATSIINFYVSDLLKWCVKTLVRHPDRRFPSYRDWESRRQYATFDCSRAKDRLGWEPTSDRADLIRRGIEEPLLASMR